MRRVPACRYEIRIAEGPLARGLPDRPRGAGGAARARGRPRGVERLLAVGMGVVGLLSAQPEDAGGAAGGEGSGGAAAIGGAAGGGEAQAAAASDEPRVPRGAEPDDEPPAAGDLPRLPALPRPLVTTRPVLSQAQPRST